MLILTARANDIIEAHGGKIDYSTIRKGTTFTVKLP
jgi:signal transduction histidine kinase